MSQRSAIVNALVDVLKGINGRAPYTSNLYSRNVTNKLKFWDEVKDFPFICVVAGTETREYLPSNFIWGNLNISLKLYVRGQDSSELLEALISDVEKVVGANENLPITLNGAPSTTAEILVTSIVTDEGLLDPYGVGEINLQVKYQVL